MWPLNTAVHLCSPSVLDIQPSFCVPPPPFLSLSPCGASLVDPGLTHRIPWISWLLGGPPAFPRPACLLPTGVPVFSRKEARLSDQLTRLLHTNAQIYSLAEWGRSFQLERSHAAVLPLHSNSGPTRKMSHGRIHSIFTRFTSEASTNILVFNCKKHIISCLQCGHK